MVDIKKFPEYAEEWILIVNNEVVFHDRSPTKIFRRAEMYRSKEIHIFRVLRDGSIIESEVI